MIEYCIISNSTFMYKWWVCTQLILAIYYTTEVDGFLLLTIKLNFVLIFALHTFCRVQCLRERERERERERVRVERDSEVHVFHNQSPTLGVPSLYLFRCTFWTEQRQNHPSFGLWELGVNRSLANNQPISLCVTIIYSMRHKNGDISVPFRSV